MLRLHRLTPIGIDRFQKFLDSQTSAEPEAFDRTILLTAEHAELAGAAPLVSPTCSFTTRLDAAIMVSSIVEAAALRDAALDRGVWSWLSWLWFESLCETTKDGLRKPGEPARWVLNLDYTRYYRHLLAGPWWIYNSHRAEPSRAASLLCTPVENPGELVGQVAAYQELVSNPSLVAMVTRLYHDSSTNKLRRGHAGKNAGSARRLVKVVRQLDMIWDLYSSSPDELVNLLPPEFDRFRRA